MNISNSVIKAREFYELENSTIHILKMLTKYLITKRDLSFTREEFQDVVILENANLIYKTQIGYEIKDYTLFAISFIEFYKKWNDYEYDLDFNKTVSFVKSMIEEFLLDGYISNIYYLKKEIWKIVIYEANHQCSIDFKDFLNQMHTQIGEEDICDFIEGYNAVLSELDIDSQTHFGNSLLLKEISSRKPELHLDSRRVLYGLKELTKINSQIGSELLELAINSSPLEEDIILLVISGLYSKQGKIFYEQKVSIIIKQENLALPIIRGLTNIDRMEQEDIDLIIEIFDTEKNNPQTFAGVIDLLFSVFNPRHSSVIVDLDLNGIFESIRESIELDNGQLTWGILRETSSFIKDDTRKKEIIESIIAQSYFSLDRYSNSVEDVLRNIESVEIIKSIIIAIAEKSQFVRFSNYSAFNHLRFNKSDFDNMLIELITNNKANIRFVGISIFNSQTIRQGYTFEKNILDLPPLFQYKLWVGLTQDFLEPKYILPALLPLIFSSSEIVKEAFSCKIEEYTENYDTQVIEVLEKHIDKDFTEQTEILIRIKKHLDQFNEINILPKERIREINPFYTQNKLYFNFNRLKYKTSNSKLDKSVLDHGFLKEIARNINVGKGGGWKTKGREEITRLGHFQYGFTLPRDYFIFPDQFEIEMSLGRREDWDENEFDFIQN